MKAIRGFNRNSFVGGLLVGVLLAPAMFHSLPDVRQTLRTADLMRRARSWSARRAMLWGEYYTALADIRERLPLQSEIAIVLAGPSELQAGIFANYYLYPHHTIIYWGKDNYRTNTTEGAAQTRRRPHFVVWIDDSSGKPPMLMTGAELLTR